MSVVKRVFKFFLLLGLLVGALGAGAFAFMVWLFSPELPSIDVLKDVHLQTPLRVYTRDGRLMAEFGEKRRIPLRLDEVPPAMVQAVVASEDERFFQHPGVDWQGLVRAVAYLVRTGGEGPGRQHRDDAGGAQFLPRPGKDLRAQAQGDSARP